MRAGGRVARDERIRPFALIEDNPPKLTTPSMPPVTTQPPPGTPATMSAPLFTLAAVLPKPRAHWHDRSFPNAMMKPRAPHPRLMVQAGMPLVVPLNAASVMPGDRDRAGVLRDVGER